MNEYDYLAKASKKMDDEKYHEVISLCDKALKLNENLPKAYEYRGNAKFELGEYEEALTDISTTVEMEPDESKHYYDRSWIYSKLDEDEKAIVDIRKAIELEPKVSFYYYDKARFEYWLERYEEAILDFSIGIELKTTPTKYIWRGRCYMKLEQYEQALADFNKAIEIDSEASDAYYYRGVLNKNRERLEEAAVDFQKTLEICPTDDDAMIELGFTKICLGQKGVMKYFDMAIKTKPSAQNYYYRVQARSDILKRKNALEKMNAGEEIVEEPDDIYNEKQAKDDIKDLNKAIALKPADAKLYRKRLDRYTYISEYEKAFEDALVMIELEPDNMEFHLECAYQKFYASRYEEAIEEIDLYFKHYDGTGDASAFFFRGMSNFELGNYKDAVVDYTNSVFFVEEAGTYYFRGIAHYKLGHFIQAYSDIKKAKEMDKNVEDTMYVKIPKLIKFFMNIKRDAT